MQLSAVICGYLELPVAICSYLQLGVLSWNALLVCSPGLLSWIALLDCSPSTALDVLLAIQIYSHGWGLALRSIEKKTNDKSDKLVVRERKTHTKTKNNE